MYIIKNGEELVKSEERIPDNLKGCPAIETTSKEGINLPHGWRIGRDPHGWYRLVDQRGDFQAVKTAEEVLEIVTTSGSWLGWDLYQNAKELFDLRNQIRILKEERDEARSDCVKHLVEIDRLRYLARQIGDINHDDPVPGSRRVITRLLAEAGVVPCAKCGNYTCFCK